MEIRYIKLLTYNQACDVIKFVNNNDIHDYANPTTGGVSVQSIDFKPIEKFIKDKGWQHEWSEVPPHKVNEKIVESLKDDILTKEKKVYNGY